MWKSTFRSTHDYDVYGIGLRIIRTYYKNKSKLADMLEESPTSDGMPRGSGVGDPVANMAIRRERLKTKVDAVEWSLNQIPEEYREGVLNKIIYRKPYPEIAHPQTWKYYKNQLVWGVVYKMGDN